MLLITCPVCSLKADESAFASGGPAHQARVAEGGSDAAFRDYLYRHDRQDGHIRHELWLCRHGCGKWFVVVRDAVARRVLATHRIGAPCPRIADAGDGTP